MTAPGRIQSPEGRETPEMADGRREAGGGRRGAPTLTGYFSGIASLLITLQFDI